MRRDLSGGWFHISGLGFLGVTLQSAILRTSWKVFFLAQKQGLNGTVSG